MAEPVALAALMLDAALGWPEWIYRRVGHPVGAFAQLIAACERRWNRPFRRGDQRRALGLATLVLLVLLAGAASWGAECAIRAAAGPWFPAP